eukprot:4993125-Pleurochrysis_carterae.AAC.4
MNTAGNRDHATNSHPVPFRAMALLRGDAGEGVNQRINRLLREETGLRDDAGLTGRKATEPFDVKLSILLTKLQLQAADADAAVQTAGIALVAAAPQVSPTVLAGKSTHLQTPPGQQDAAIYAQKHTPVRTPPSASTSERH